MFGNKSTAFVTVNTHNCIACNKCVEVCGNSVLAIKGPSFHRHVHLIRKDACKGCLKCVQCCENGVFGIKTIYTCL